MSSPALPIGAVDIGGTKIAVGLVEAGGRLLARGETPTQPGAGFEAAMLRVAGLFESFGVGGRTALAGIGIGCTGPVDPFSGCIGAVEFLAGWQGCSPSAWLGARLGVPAVLENDADAAALAEHACGAGRGLDSLVSLTVGTGIGAGIIAGGRLFRGAGGAHPEVGHHVLDASGPRCYCGARGCWEVLASGPAIAARLLQHAPAGYAHAQGLDARRACELAREGDGPAREEVARAGHYLGLGIANLVTLFVPELIVLTGSVMESADLFLPAIHATVQAQCTQVPAGRVRLCRSSLGADAPLVGAAMAWRHASVDRHRNGQGRAA